VRPFDQLRYSDSPVHSVFSPRNGDSAGAAAGVPIVPRIQKLVVGAAGLRRSEEFPQVTDGTVHAVISAYVHAARRG